MKFTWSFYLYFSPRFGLQLFCNSNVPGDNPVLQWNHFWSLGIALVLDKIVSLNCRLYVMCRQTYKCALDANIDEEWVILFK